MLEMHSKQPEFTYTKNKEKIQKFKGTEDSRYIYIYIYTVMN